MKKILTSIVVGLSLTTGCETIPHSACCPTYFDNEECGTYGNGYVFGSEFQQDKEIFENTPVPRYYAQ